MAGGIPAVIRDAPRFAHRGLMVDTARHYYPVAALQQLLQAMTAAKLTSAALKLKTVLAGL